jgi:hypothetical protein
MEYHKNKDIIHCQQVLGHKEITSTMLYISLENALFNNGKPEEFYVKVAHNMDEACQLLEIGLNTSLIWMETKSSGNENEKITG